MKRLLLLIVFITLFLPFLLFDFTSSKRPHTGISPKSQKIFELDYARLPLIIEPNEGQTDPRVKFLAHGRGYSLFITPQEAVLSIKKSENPSRSLLGNASHTKSSYIPISDTGPPAVLHLKLVGARAKTVFEGLEQLPGISNYLIGKKPSLWHINIPQYAKVMAQDVYPGVDMLYYGKQGQLEYDFRVKPGSDPNIIRIQYTGVDSARVDNQGNLRLGMGNTVVRFKLPTIYQEKGGIASTVSGKYIVISKNEIGFEVGEYDKSRTLIIDPILLYSTYLGGSGDEAVLSVAVNAAGNAYVTGFTESANFPLTGGVYQNTLKGTSNVFISKLNPTGSALIYSTYLGGNGYDAGTGIAIDGNGNAYVTGATTSANFPTSPGAFQMASGGVTNAFVTKLNPTGTGLVYSTFLGGNTADGGLGIQVDGNGNAYVTGSTYSTNFPTSVGAYQTSLVGTANAFVTKLNSGGTALVYSTYLGGNGADIGFGIALDGSENGYIVGSTTSTTFPTTAGSIQTSQRGSCNAFVAELNPSGTSLIYSTYLGGSASDAGHGIAVDGAGEAYVIGTATSLNFPTTGGVFQPNLVGSSNAFISKVNFSGTSLIFSTYLGGSGSDGGMGIALDAGGNPYTTGFTQSSNFPVITGDLQTVSGGMQDAFLSELNSSGTTLLYSIYFGGSQNDTGLAIALNAPHPYVVGQTASTDFPITGGAYQTTYGGGTGDGFIFNINCAIITPTPTFTPTLTPTPTLTLTPTKTSTPQFTLTPTITLSPTPGDYCWVSCNAARSGQQVEVKVLLDNGGKCSLKIYNSAGEYVRDLAEENLLPYQVGDYIWDRKNNTGTEVSSGVYMIRMVSSYSILVKKVMLVH